MIDHLLTFLSFFLKLLLLKRKIFQFYMKIQNARCWHRCGIILNFSTIHFVLISLDMPHFSITTVFENSAFSTNFCPIKNDLSGSSV